MESPSPGLRSNIRGRPSGIVLVLATILIALILTVPAASADDFDPFPEEELPLLAADNLVATTDESDVILEWTSPESRVDSWIVTLNSTPVTSTRAEVHTAIVYDVDRTKSAVFSVIPVDKNGVQGPACITYLEPISDIALFELPEDVSDRTWEPNLPQGVEIASDTGWNGEGNRTITVAPRAGFSFSDDQPDNFTIHVAEKPEAGNPPAPPERSTSVTTPSSPTHTMPPLPTSTLSPTVVVSPSPTASTISSPPVNSSATGTADSVVPEQTKPGAQAFSIVIGSALLVGLGTGVFVYLHRRR